MRKHREENTRRVRLIFCAVILSILVTSCSDSDMYSSNDDADLVSDTRSASDYEDLKSGPPPVHIRTSQKDWQTAAPPGYVDWASILGEGPNTAPTSLSWQEVPPLNREDNLSISTTSTPNSVDFMHYPNGVNETGIPIGEDFISHSLCFSDEGPNPCQLEDDAHSLLLTIPAAIMEETGSPYFAISAAWIDPGGDRTPGRNYISTWFFVTDTDAK